MLVVLIERLRHANNHAGDFGGPVVFQHGRGIHRRGHRRWEQRLYVQADLVSRSEVPNDRTNHCDELGHNHGGLATVCTVTRLHPGHYGAKKVKRRG